MANFGYWMLPVTRSVPPFAFAVMSPNCSASRANVTVPCRSVMAKRGSRTTRPPFSIDIRPSTSGWSARPVTFTSSAARPVVATLGENALSMRRSSVPSSMKSSAGEAPVNSAPPETLMRFPAPAHVQSSTCSRPSASRNRVGRLWLSGTRASESSARSSVSSASMSLHVERGCRQRDDRIHPSGHVGECALLDKRRERRRCDRTHSENGARGLARCGQSS